MALSEIKKEPEKIERQVNNLEYITPIQMQKKLGLSRSTVYRIIHSENFYPAIKLEKRVLINKIELKKWLDEHRINKED